jgi:hypothetical protein
VLFYFSLALPFWFPFWMMEATQLKGKGLGIPWLWFPFVMHRWQSPTELYDRAFRAECCLGWRGLCGRCGLSWFALSSLGEGCSLTAKGECSLSISLSLSLFLSIQFSLLFFAKTFVPSTVVYHFASVFGRLFGLA